MSAAPALSLEEELRGIYDDPEYGRFNDVTKYMSMRYESRGQFFASLYPELQRRIENEMNNIAKLRLQIAANGNLLNTHLARREEWRMEAMRNQRRNVGDLIKRLIDHGEGSTHLQVHVGSDKRHKYLMNERRILEAISTWPAASETEPPLMMAQLESDTSEIISFGMSACIMHFHKGHGGYTRKYHHRKVIGQFPNQKIDMNYLLADSEDNPLKQSCEPGSIRYFHLPSNNMEWVEKVIALYYDDRDTFNSSLPNPRKFSHSDWQLTGAQRLLARESWKGQMLGVDAARHMRPAFLASRIDLSKSPAPLSGRNPPRRSPDITSSPAKTQLEDYIIFMPYLHWETSHKLTKMTEILHEATHRRTQKKLLPLHREERKAEFLRAANLAKLKSKYRYLGGCQTSCLGPYLMSVARIYDAMDHIVDEKLLRNSFHNTSPLHVRRTLDQTYFSTMSDMGTRSKDQVVYRGTRGGVHSRPRVVMVDQLWMWILDENTILTSYPRRWGRNKPDPSGIHKSLRERLSHLPDERINNVFDLALYIIDECSRVFFDRRKPLDQRPEVMDIFSNTISKMTGMKTIATGNFWSQMRMDSLQDPSEPFDKSAHAYLNMNTEGTLLRECQDIIEELRMMSRIFTQQEQVVKDFRRELQNMNNNEYDGDTDPNDVVSQLGKMLREAGMLPKAPVFSAEMPRTPLRVPRNTIRGADEVIEQILQRKKEIDELEQATQGTVQQLQDLLGLKQQQASIIEARMAIKRAELNQLSVNQGRSIMLFTIVTILFLPLSFFTSFFGMNNSEWEKNPMSMHYQFKIMFPISMAVIVISLFLAFSVKTAAFFSMIVTVSWAYIVEYTHLYWIKDLTSSWQEETFAAMEHRALARIGNRQAARLQTRSKLEVEARRRDVV